MNLYVAFRDPRRRPIGLNVVLTRWVLLDSEVCDVAEQLITSAALHGPFFEMRPVSDPTLGFCSDLWGDIGVS